MDSDRIAMIAAREPGWAYFNPDTGMEWARNHPINSGECDDAEQVERMTYGTFVLRFCQGQD